MPRPRLFVVTAITAAVAAAVALIAMPAGSDPPPAHAQLSTSFDQFGGGTVEFDQIDSIAGASFDPTTDELTLNEPGLWLVVAAPQVGSIKNPGSVGSANFWIAADGVDVPNSNVTWQAKGSGSGDVIVSQGVGFFTAGTKLTVEWSTTGPALEAITTPGEPLTPSIIFTAFRIG